MTDISKFAWRYDAVVIGARCAGAATAMLLAKSGLRVLAIDRQGYRTDTLSTHAMMRGGVVQLAKWRLLGDLARYGTPPVRQTVFGYGRDEYVIDIKPAGDVDALYAPRRTVLDRVLVEAAIAAGAHVLHGVNLQEVMTDAHGRVCGAKLRMANNHEVDVLADIVIGADGRQSAVARMVGAQTYVQAQSCSSAVFGYFAGIPDRGYRWLHEVGMSASAIPTNDGHHCICALTPGNRFRQVYGRDIHRGFMQVIANTSPQLAAELASGKLQGRLRGFAGTPGFLRQVHGPGWALVGDAGYFKDPITAHGITDALRDAELLARAVVGGSQAHLAAYQEERDELSLALFQVTDAIASFAWNLDEVQQHHKALSKAMQAENDRLGIETQAPALAA